MIETKRWTDVPGRCIVSGIYCSDSGTIEPNMGDDWSEPIVTAIHNAAANTRALQNNDEIELMIGFKSKGYEDPGRITGPPEDCYPPEGEDEREVVDAWVRHYRPVSEASAQLIQSLDLPESIYNDLSDQFEAAINEVEIEKD